MKHVIDVDVQTSYLDGESLPDSDKYVFAYTVTVTNNGDVAARLLTRHWIITDANFHVQEVKGDGVVGEQPHLVPGSSFQYTSGTVFATPVGTMEGSYHLMDDDGTEFDVMIPPFSFSQPGKLQ